MSGFAENKHQPALMLHISCGLTMAHCGHGPVKSWARLLHTQRSPRVCFSPWRDSTTADHPRLRRSIPEALIT